MRIVFFKTYRVTDAMGVDKIAWGEYAGKSGRKQSIMGHETHSYASWGRGTGPWKSLQRKSQSERRKTELGGRLETDP